MALLLALWAALASLRGPACPWTWLRGLEGIGVALVAWVAAEGIATYWGGVWRELTPWEQGRVLGRVSLIVAIILVLAWGLVGLALCRGWA